MFDINSVVVGPTYMRALSRAQELRRTGEIDPNKNFRAIDYQLLGETLGGRTVRKIYIEGYLAWGIGTSRAWQTIRFHRDLWASKVIWL